MVAEEEDYVCVAAFNFFISAFKKSKNWKMSNREMQNVNATRHTYALVSFLATVHTHRSLWWLLPATKGLVPPLYGLSLRLAPCIVKHLPMPLYMHGTAESLDIELH